MTTLPFARDFDLPPMWDGDRIVWEGWQADPPSTLDYHLKPEPCPACGLFEPHTVNLGVIWSKPRVRPFRRARTYAEAALNSAADRKGTPIGWLFAYRCTGCRFDQVYECNTKQMWDLDESDYHAFGSHDPARPTTRGRA